MLKHPSKVGGGKFTPEELQELSIEDVKKLILKVDPKAFDKKASAKKKSTSRKTAKKPKAKK